MIQAVAKHWRFLLFLLLLDLLLLAGLALPVVQPWFEDPVDGWMAERRGAVPHRL